MSGKVFLISPEAATHQFAGAGDTRKIKPGGIRLGTLDNTKGNADHLLAFCVENLQKVLNISSVLVMRKNNPSTPAPAPVLDRLTTECDFVISAMGD